MPPQAYVQPPGDRNRGVQAERASLLQRLQDGALDVIDSPRGVVVMLPDADFDGATPRTSLARVSQVLNSTPGISIEVDGYADLPGEQHETLAEVRAQRVRQALIGSGFNGATVTARNMGSGHPLGPDREQNRRVEIVVSGAGIGNVPLWDKSYSLSLR